MARAGPTGQRLINQDSIVSKHVKAVGVACEWQLTRPVSVRCSRLGTKVPVFSIRIHLTQIWTHQDGSDTIYAVLLQDAAITPESSTI